MAVQEIIKFPDPVLHEVCREVDDFGIELQTFVGDMIDTLIDARGAGLAAPQLGVTERVICFVAGRNDIMVMVNPVIVKRSPQMATANEACLSLPARKFHVQRSKRIRVRWVDLNGVDRSAKFSGHDARVIQHEVDHLDGILLGGL